MGLKIIRELGTKISLVFDKKSAEEAKSKIEEVAETLKHTSLRVAELTGTLFGFAKAASSNSRELEEYSQQLGINVERLQELEYGAKVAAHVNREELMGSLEGVSKSLYDARNGNVETLKSLDRLQLGFDFLNDTTVTADKVLMKLADGLKNVQNPMARMGILSAVGVSPKLIPYLAKGSKGIADMGKEARSLGVVLDQGMIEKGKEFDQTLSRLWIVLKNVTFTIGHELIRYFEPLVNEWVKFVVVNKKLIASGIGAFFKSMSAYLMIIFKTIKFIAERVKFLVEVMGGLEKVTKVVAIAMGIFTAAKLVAGIGSLIKVVRGLVALMGVLDLEALAVAAAMLAVVLVVQDLFSDDSLIKEWIGYFKEEFPNATKFFVGAFDIVKEAIIDTVEAFKTVYEWVMKGIDAISQFGSYLNNAFSIGQKAKDAFSWIVGKGGSALGAMGDFMEGRANAAAAARPSPGVENNSSSSTKNSFEANVQVTVPPGTSGKAATGMVTDGVREAFDSMFRKTKNQASGGVAY